MNRKKNAYDIIGTSRDAVYLRKTEQEKDVFVREKKEDSLRVISRKIERIEEKIRHETRQDKKQELLSEKQNLELEKESISSAYLEICNSLQRSQYDVELDINPDNIRKKINKEKKRVVIEDDPYKSLYTSKEKCDDTLQDTNQINTFLLARRDDILQNENHKLQSLRNRLTLLQGDNSSEAFRQKSRLEGDIARIEKEIEQVQNAYEKIKDAKARETYNVELQEKQKQEAERIRKSDIRRDYEVAQYARLDLILQVGYKPLEKDEEKDNNKTEKRRKLMEILIRQDGTEVKVERIGMLGYRNARNVMGTIDAYRITRVVNGEEKSDVRFSNLNMIDLSRDAKTGEFQNKEYHDFVANVFLSEDSIEGTKYNAGYIGEALKDKDGKYLQDFSDINELSAVMKLNEKERNAKAHESKEGEIYE